MSININKISREIKKIYKETDVQMKTIDKVCKENCPYCCHQIISVHAAEELPIVKYIVDELEDKTINALKNNLENWFDYFDDNTPNRILNQNDITNFSNQHVQDYRACPFLIEDKCAIYQVRPLVCRTFSVNDSPDKCKEQPDRIGDPKGYKIQESKFNAIVRVTNGVQLRLLPYAVSESFGIKRSLKAIESEAIVNINTTPNKL